MHCSRNIAIIGYGIVGKATHHSVLADDPNVTLYDINNPYTAASPSHDLIFVCVPTSDAADLERLRTLCLDIIAQDPGVTLCIRSSVPVGFLSQQLQQHAARLIYFPEFLRERRWLQDAKIGAWIIGCDHSCRGVLDEFCQHKEVMFVSTIEAEIIKMMANSYAAMNVAFANHIYDLSQQLGARYSVIESAHDRVRHRDQNYLKVTPELRGFGGKCLPKDLDFLIDTFAKNNLDQTLFDGIKQDNRKWPTTVRLDP